jgi:hypothetical protein
MLLRDLTRSGIARKRTDGSNGAGMLYRGPTGKAMIAVARGYGGSPLATLAHEAGHLKKPAHAVGVQAAIAGDRGQVSKAALLDLKQERMANRGAVGILKTYGVSPTTRNQYRAAVAPAFRTYRNSAASALVRERGVSTTHTASMTAAGARALAGGATLQSVDKMGEAMRKRLIPGYAATKRQVSVSNQAELKKYFQRDFEAEFIARLQKLDARLNQLVALSKKSP